MKKEERRNFRGNSNLDTCICKWEKKEAVPLFKGESKQPVTLPSLKVICAEGRDHLYLYERQCCMLEPLCGRLVFFQKLLHIV